METKTYEGGCHCGKVRFKVTTNLTPVIACNCSICSKRGALLTFVPPSSFELLAGENATTEYLFNKHVIHHLFCSTCGVASYAHGTDPKGNKMVAVNARCLDDLDITKLEVTHFDGKSL